MGVQFVRELHLHYVNSHEKKEAYLNIIGHKSIRYQLKEESLRKKY